MPTKPDWGYGRPEKYPAKTPVHIRQEVLSLVGLSPDHSEAFWFHVDRSMFYYQVQANDKPPNAVSRKAAADTLLKKVDELLYLLRFPHEVGGIGADLEFMQGSPEKYDHAGGLIPYVSEDLARLRVGAEYASKLYEGKRWRVFNPKQVFVLSVITGFRHFGLDVKNTYNLDSGQPSQLVAVLVICFQHCDNGVIPGDLKTIISLAMAKESGERSSGELSELPKIYSRNGYS